VTGTRATRTPEVRSEPVPRYLSEIVAAHRARAAGDRRDVSALREAALAAPRGTPFAAGIREAGARAGAGGVPGLAVVAEVKRRSPSAGDLATDLEPGPAAADYAAGGAACLSVLTDADHFGGSASDLAAARDAAGLPVLRKDFTVCESDLYDARLMGADAVLLIVAALSDDELLAFSAAAEALGLDCLVEVHDETELRRALDAGARLLGVNQRDLATFEVDAGRAERLASAIPSSVVAVAESGIKGPGAARRLAESGYDAVLVGEALVTARDRRAAVRALVGHPVLGRGRARRVVSPVRGAEAVR
jgi:indole-3-glycerol phosphate synthase